MSQIFLSESIFPPTREYSRAAELTKLHDDYFLERWPFDDEQQRSNFLCMDTAGFTTAGEFVLTDAQMLRTYWAVNSCSRRSVWETGMGIQVDDLAVSVRWYIGNECQSSFIILRIQDINFISELDGFCG